MDDELRDAERRYATSRDPEDEGRLVLARVRAGLLDEAHVELAARLGHLPAGRALAVRAAPCVPNGWLAQVRLALARRLLEAPDAPRPRAHVVRYRGPPGTNDGRRFVLPAHAEVVAALGTTDPWEVHATYGEGEHVVIGRASRAPFADLADFWVEVGLPHEDLGDVGADRRALARRLLERDAWRAEPLAEPLAASVCQDRGFASPRTWDGFRALLGGPLRRGLRIADEWNEVTDLLETDDAYLIAHWSTSA